MQGQVNRKWFSIRMVLTSMPSALGNHEIHLTPNLTLGHKLVFETFQELQRELIFSR